jgi:hypothetical protein
MAAEIMEHFEVIEECYEFMLAYAGQGLASDKGGASGKQIREFLNRAVNASSACRATVWRRWGTTGQNF